MNNITLLNPNETNAFCCILMLLVVVCIVVYTCQQTKNDRYRYREMFGTDTDVATAQTLNDCQMSCDSHIDCKGFIFNPNTKKCTTKTSFTTGSGTLAPGSVTYYLKTITPPYDTNRAYNKTYQTGYDATGLIGNSFNDSADNCKLACQNVQNCVGYVYDTTVSGSPTCALHTEWGANSVVPLAATYLTTSSTTPLPRQYAAVPNIVYIN